MAAALIGGVATLGSCASEHLGTSNDGKAETATRLDAAGADRCSGSISDVGGKCQASFDGTVADLPACTGADQRVKLCSGVLVLSQASGFTALTCFYDAATHVLVGALEQSDTPQFCGDSFGRIAGEVPGPSCDAVSPFLVKNCSNRDATAD